MGLTLLAALIELTHLPLSHCLLQQPNRGQIAHRQTARSRREHVGWPAPMLWRSLPQRQNALWCLWRGLATPPARLLLGLKTCARAVMEEVCSTVGRSARSA